MSQQIMGQSTTITTKELVCEALSMEQWSNEAAACYMTLVDPFAATSTNFHLTEDGVFKTTNVKNKATLILLTIIETWGRLNKRIDAHPYWFLNMAIKKQPPNVNLAPFLDKLRVKSVLFMPKDIVSIIEQYPYLAQALDLKISQHHSDKAVVEQALVSSQSHERETIPSYLDKDHPNFSIEFYLAFHAWNELFADKGKSPDYVRKQVEKVMDQLGIEVIGKNNSVINRIATVINPNSKKGTRGAPLSLKFKTSKGHS